MGTNGAYIEKAQNVRAVAEETGDAVLNIEWGTFSGDVCRTPFSIPQIFNLKQNLERTRFDYRVDRESANPGLQVFEKLTAGMYIGEVLRLVILHFIDIEPRTWHR